MRTLNLGILAHVDAGKTTLTERLLYAAGVIDQIGSVDAGTTQTDNLALEKQRGITIKAAVVSFAIDDVTVNLIDTPGHPDFIAEVERVLNVLDGAVLVISAVEGVQAQTRILLRTLERLRIPTLLFVNKIDRAGAQYDDVLQAIARHLTPAIIAMGSIRDPGTRRADFIPYGAADRRFLEHLAEMLADHDDRLLAAYVDEPSLSHEQLRASLAEQTMSARVHPVFFGSAITGAGVGALMAGIAELLPAAEGDRHGPVSGVVFKVERGASGEKIAYVRMFSGTLGVRDRVTCGRADATKVTSIAVFDAGAVVQRPSVVAGRIAKLWGLGQIRIGDAVGAARLPENEHYFAPPTLETIIVPRQPAERGALHAALSQLAEQDPLIDLRQDLHHELYVSLYGEVQKQVIEATLLDDFGIGVEFRDTTTICVERPTATGYAIELLQDDENPFSATVGLRIEPAPVGSGVEFRLDVDPRRVPLYIYKRAEKFYAAMTGYVARTLQEGLSGWNVTDCTVTMDACGYYVGDGPTKPSAPTPRTTAADFRKLTPLVLMLALARARTTVCEPMMQVSIEIPTDAVGAVLGVVARLDAVVDARTERADLAVIDTLLTAARVQDLIRQLPALTGGMGVVETSFAGYRPVNSGSPVRRRTMANPLNRVEYMMAVRGREF
jgi:ribosomal protection tetracycline resistance protein